MGTATFTKEEGRLWWPEEANSYKYISERTISNKLLDRLYSLEYNKANVTPQSPSRACGAEKTFKVVVHIFSAKGRKDVHNHLEKRVRSPLAAREGEALQANLVPQLAGE